MGDNIKNVPLKGREVLTIKCPKCSNNMERLYYSSRGGLTTYWRIKCTSCKKVDTGYQGTNTSAFEKLIKDHYKEV